MGKALGQGWKGEEGRDDMRVWMEGRGMGREGEAGEGMLDVDAGRVAGGSEDDTGDGENAVRAS